MPALLAIAILMLNVIVIASAAGAPRGFAREVDRLVRPYLDAQKTHGLSIGILREGRTFVRGYGRFSEEDDREPDGDTLYEIASVTKVFTGVMLADLALREDVKLTQPAGKLLPPGVKMPSAGARPITLLDLATHVSGLPRLPSNLPNRSADNHYKGYTDELLYEFLDKHALRRPPGAEYEYSNLGFGLLGTLLAQRVGTDYESLLRSRITKPLRMSDTSIELSARKLLRLAPPHRADLEPTVPWTRDALHGAGAIHSSVKDLLTFAAASIAPPRGRVGAALDLAWRQHRPPVEGTNYAMGLGWFHSSDGHTRYHTGSTGGYRSAIYASRKRGVATVVLANAKGLEADDLAVELYRMTLGLEVPTREYDPAPEVPVETMQQYVGRYRNAKGKHYTVAVRDGKLMVGYTRSRTYRLFPVTETQWRYRPSQATLTFRQNDEEEWDSLEYIRSDYAETAERVDEAAAE